MPTCAWCGKFGHSTFRSKRCVFYDKWKRRRLTKATNLRTKNTGLSNPCLLCGGIDHTRATSAKCPRHREWKSLSKGDKAKISYRLRKKNIRQKQNPKKTGTPNLCLWCGGNDHRRASSQKCQRHFEWKSLSQAEKSKKSKQKHDSKHS